LGVDAVDWQAALRRPASAIGHVDHVDAGHLLEQLAGEMRGGTSPRPFIRVLLTSSNRTSSASMSRMASKSRALNRSTSIQNLAGYAIPAD
jgi:hypothetical protein